jgi:hypothetical protein
MYKFDSQKGDGQKVDSNDKKRQKVDDDLRSTRLVKETKSQWQLKADRASTDKWSTKTKGRQV